MSRFLAGHPDFAQVPLARAWPLETPPPRMSEATDQATALALTPARHGTDGFFAAVLQRR